MISGGAIRVEAYNDGGALVYESSDDENAAHGVFI